MDDLTVSLTLALGTFVVLAFDTVRQLVALRRARTASRVSAPRRQYRPGRPLARPYPALAAACAK